MSNKQQTAVEWYDNEIGKLFDQFTMGKIKIYEFQNQRFKLEKQAKEVEKERMIDFANNCIKQIEVSDTCELLMVESPKDLYEQTYGGEEQ